MTTKAKNIDHLLEAFRAKFSYDGDSGMFFLRNGGKPVGCVNVAGYVHLKLLGKLYYGHRVAWLMEHGACPDGIDHVDGDRANNRIKNLRPADKSQNGFNRPKQANNSSGYKGVSPGGKTTWCAKIHVKGKKIFLGHFPTQVDAARAYDIAAKQHHGDFAVTNGV